MNNTERVTPTPAQEQAAFAWLSLLHDQPSSGDQATFSHWLQADPAHAEAYAQAQVVWELTETPARTLADEEAFALQGYLSAMNRSRRTRVLRWSGALAMAACMVLMIGVGAGWQPSRWVDDLGADYVSAPGEIRTVTLADQSHVTLDADSAIAVDFSRGERRVELRRGAGFFSVTHTGEPFVVDAEKGQARVLGTQFEVRLQPLGAQVTVLSGRVGVTADRHAEQQILSAGQQVAYGEGSAEKLHAVDSEAQLAWRQGWLNYYKATLAEVVQDLGRYYPGRIVLLNDELAARRVSGSFPSKDPLAVLSSLQGVLGFEQHKVLGHLIILR
ncbi:MULTISPECIES: FecR family protein [unclassified Pseudomonas]|uniref:FecR family protein n=1 Tax=unclassified Pseudomonas TaxID=196821 RepID=UPI000C876AB2|nr:MULTISPECIES: FecR family protein [unclassified Pseudomonas]PMU12291.1 sugar ABC transporter substrate-binding protein [Pseudomonas sp. FW305-20]PMU19704.1 sugar ABC transporter substrate-binding protein [Pseudomonas sp. FW305-122]PMU42716.1 sugar ABC transporter substrate-binding protein [Pseudomonas sp. FW305-47B]PMX62170.1 sugar ABC transporter substrate-binding protein [Pseudomonas sp. FW305-33]PMX69947.1 sugar ABC transporter substrate-binding protein [Pseudomonas sp. FW305-60]